MVDDIDRGLLVIANTSFGKDCALNNGIGGLIYKPGQRSRTPQINIETIVTLFQMIEDMVYQCRFSCSSDGKKGNILLVPDGVDDFISLLFPVTEDVKYLM